RRYASIRSCSARVCTSTLLPSMTMSLPGCALRARTSSTTLALSRVELRQAVAEVRVVETTYLGTVFNMPAIGSSSASGSKAPPWICHVLRPRSMASLWLIPWAKWGPVSSCQYGHVHPPWEKPPSVSSSLPPGACITPSSDTNSETTILRIDLLLLLLQLIRLPALAVVSAALQGR